jgi:hypothetical protein
MEICAYCDGEGFSMRGIQIINCHFCKGTGIIGGLKQYEKKEDIHKVKVPKKPILKVDKRNI